MAVGVRVGTLCAEYAAFVYSMSSRDGVVDAPDLPETVGGNIVHTIFSNYICTI